jgi:proline dehydrogenase
METSPLSGRLTKRFVAGRTLDEGLAVCRKLNRDGILVTFDHLGESVASAAEAEASRDAYLAVLRDIHAEGLLSTVSIKLSQFGLEISADSCRANVEQVVRLARDTGASVEIDMEASPCVDRTLEIVRAMHARYGCVRAVVQAYLRRTESDVESLCREAIPVRLCKGAYKEPPEVAFPAKAEVDRNYVKLARVLLEKGPNPAIATHDPKMIQAALAFAKERGLAPSRFEFQMLYGIRRDLQDRLLAGGYRLRLYVPYGLAWYPYFMRRLAERPANLLFLLRNLFRH